MEQDLTLAGKYDYLKNGPTSQGGWNTTFSVGVFKWELSSDKKRLKKGKAVVRVSGPISRKEDVFQMCKNVTILLNSGDWDGRKTVKVL